MKSEKILSLMAMSRHYGKRPSEILPAGDEYTSYCFDQTCFYINNRLTNGESPIFQKEYGGFADFYGSLKERGVKNAY